MIQNCDQSKEKALAIKDPPGLQISLYKAAKPDFEIPRLTLRELEAATSLLEAVLLTLNHAAVSCQVATISECLV